MNKSSIDNQKRILIVGNFLSSAYGTQGICEILADKLVKADWSVETTSTQTSRLLRLLDMLSTIWRTRRHYEIAHVDVFSGTSFIWAEITTWLLRRLKKPYILTLHGGNLPPFAQRWPGRVERMLRSADAVTTPSHYLHDNLSHYRDDIQVLPNGLDLSAYHYQLRQQVKPNLAWLRAFHEIYNPSMVAAIIAQLAPDFPELELTMYGPDKADGSLQRMRQKAKEHGVNERIHTPGAVPKTKVPEYLSQHDIFLNTTTAESFGVSVMEAAALGMCIVTTNVGELPYIWTDGEDALLVPPNDPEAMANAVRRILTEPGLAEKLSRNARAKAEQFDWSVMLPQWEQLLLKVAREHFDE
jgi:glycosyltransferase involved in cell wall biosynthesis